MRAKIEGEVLGIGQSTFDGKVYPFFELLQRGNGQGGSEVVRVSGSVQGYEVGKLAVVDTLISITDAGKLRVKRIDTVFKGGGR